MPMISTPCEDQRNFSFSPEKTAFLAIDFQRDFLECDGLSARDAAERQRLSNALAPARQALTAARKAGMEIIHTREAYAADLSDVNNCKRDMGYVGLEGPLGRRLIKGEPGCDFVQDMSPRNGERVFDKPGFSAFYSTDLQSHLSAREITHLIFTGITYQCCVHSTLREAVDRGYYCLTLDDACRAVNEDLEKAVRMIIRAEGNLFGWISNTDLFSRSIDAAACPPGSS